MTTISYQGKSYDCRDDETVLETFLRHGVNVPFSCKNGVCHACLLRATRGEAPTASQKGIKPQLADKNYFLSCRCVAQQDMDIELPRSADILTRAQLSGKQRLSDDICRFLIEPATTVYYHAGQYINLYGPDGLVRSYSLASLPSQDYCLEIHVRRVTGGAMSEWLFDTFDVGDEIEFHGPLGEAYYRSGAADANMLMMSTGTGLAPHLGIIRDALSSGHQGEIYLYHGASRDEDHYARDQLAELAAAYSNLKYFLCNDAPAESGADVTGRRALDIALDRHDCLDDWMVYLSGNPDMVSEAQSRVLSAGARDNRIYADPFEHTPGDNSEATTGATEQSRSPAESISLEKRKFPDPDPEMWAALDNGKLMREILTDFYTQVFDDELLSPYFAGVTKQRLIGKVYNFHYQMFTGEKVYFGERPRNTHHWMVIPEEIFQHRERLMENTLIRHGLARHLVDRWMAYEALYKDDIVKLKPINKILFGKEVPYEGFDTLVMEFSTLCDSCGGEIQIGDTVRYHVRMGTTYCPSCISQTD